MSDYQGLNLPQLLELMHGPVIPEPVSWLPQTPGWWVLAAAFTAAVLLVLRHAWRRWRRNRYRRQARAELRTIEARADPNAAAEIAVLLKRTALAAYPRHRVAQLHGAQWARFLCETTNHDPLVAAGACELAAAAYRRDCNAAKLVEPARRWIDAHRG